MSLCILAFAAGCAPGQNESESQTPNSADPRATAATPSTGERRDETAPVADSDAGAHEPTQMFAPDGFEGTPLGGPLCMDTDGDRFGTNCANGPDCDDHDRAITDQCYRCMRPAAGCACASEGVRRSCDAVTDSDLPGPGGTCFLGERVCTAGVWSRCRALDGVVRTITPPTSCGSSCNPECRVTTVCPTTPGDLAGGTGVVLGTSLPPGFCPPGTPAGGIQLPPATVTPSTMTGCGGTCGGVCCAADETCYTYTDSTIYPTFCSGSAGRSAPPPVVRSACGRTCTTGTTHCGTAPDDTCCASGQLCRQGVCITDGGACNAAACPLASPASNNYASNTFCRSNCPLGQACDIRTSRCFRPAGNSCDCTGFTNTQHCLNSVIQGGGEVVNGIFTTPSGGDARTLRFGTYWGGLAASPSGCRTGVSSSSTGECAGCTPTLCTSYACVGSPTDTPTISRYANALDWRWTQHVRYNDTGGGVAEGEARFYLPWRSRIYDLGAPANRVALFPITDHTSDSCMEPFEYTVWLTDNPTSTQITGIGNPDPSKWNPATLVRVFTEGWTRNPNAIGRPTDTSDLNTTAFGDAVADAMTTVFAVNCGYSFRYAAISGGNNGGGDNGVPSTPACTFHSSEDELDAVAGLTVDGSSLSIYHSLPYGATAGPDSLQFTTNVRTADVYFLMDTTGSMGGAINNLKTSLQTGTFVTGCPGGIVGGIRCTIPDAWFGVGFLDDFPVSPYGSAGWDFVYRNLLDETSDLTSVQSAINSLALHAGNDGPESQIPALWSVATGNGIGSFLAARGACPPGRRGYPCFRPGSIPIVMLFTDAMFHNGPGDTYLYNDATVFGVGGGSQFYYPAATAVTLNENIASARVIPENTSFVGTGNTAAMTDHFTPGCAFSSARDAAFRLDFTSARTVHFDTAGSAFDTVLAVVRSDGTVMGCNDDAGGTLQSALDLSLGIGTYYVWIDGYGSASGAYTFRYGVPQTLSYPAAVAVAGNESAASARVITDSVSFMSTGSTATMVDNHVSPCGASSGARDATYRLDMTATRSVHFDTFGSGFDTILYVIRDDGTVMGCNDDTAGLQSSLDLTLAAGTTYYVWVDGYGAGAGNYTFRYGVPSEAPAAPVPATPRFADAVNALNAIGAKVIVVQNCGGSSWCSPDGVNHANALANQTGSVVSGGAPAVYSIPANGSGLGTAVINAVSDLASYQRMDVTAVALDNPATPGVDERCFVRSPAGTTAGTIRLSNPMIGESAAYAAGRCVDPPTSVGGVPVVARQCLPGSAVNFRAEFINNCVMSTSVAQTFTFDIVTYGSGTYELGRVPVIIVVPAIVYPPVGTFTYDVDATTVCAPGQQVDWTQLQYVADTPAGTSIRIDVQTATTSAGLTGAPVVNLGTTPPAASPLDIGPALVAAAQSNRLPHLRVRFTLNADVARTATPVLRGYRVQFNCIDGT